MATIRLNNLIKPREANSPKNLLDKEFKKNESTYTDLKLDIELSQNVGVGLSPSIAKDIVVSEDVAAVKNSIYNIFSTKKGQMLLNPEFGSSLESYLFENVSPLIANIIGESIIGSLEKYEPRIEVLYVNVLPQPDQNQYYVQLVYKFVNIKNEKTLTLFLKRGGQIVL
jgi:phage baseplate assembly protein W